MRSVKEAKEVLSAVRGEDRDTRDERRRDAPGDAPEAAGRRRMTLRHLHGLIEALREEHMKLEMRVDRLADLVDRIGMSARDAGERRMDDRYGMNGNRHGEYRLTAALPFVSGASPDARMNAESPDNRMNLTFPFTAGTAASPGARMDLTGVRGAAQPAAVEDRTAFGFAIWAGVERAIGNAAAALTAGQETGAVVPEGAAEPVTTAALFRRPRSPVPAQQEVPIESLLHELREAARIADEIAANASSAEHRTSPAHPARAPDFSDGGMSGAGAADRDASNATDTIADDANTRGAVDTVAVGANGCGAAASDTVGMAANSGGPGSTVGTGANGMAGIDAVEPDAGGRLAANGNGADQTIAEPAIDPSSADRTAQACATAEPPQNDHLQPATDMSSILIPRSERHRARKKRSLWTRLFRRQHAGS